MKTSTFVVTAADDGGVTLQDVHDSQVHTLADADFAAGEVVEATIEPEPPLEVVWQVVEVEASRELPVARSPEPPTQQATDIAADQPAGEVTRQERAGTGEVHVITLPEDTDPEAAADEVVDDPETLARAARLGVDRVEVRVGEALVSVRYLPD